MTGEALINSIVVQLLQAFNVMLLFCLGLFCLSELVFVAEIR